MPLPEFVRGRTVRGLPLLFPALLWACFLACLPAARSEHITQCTEAVLRNAISQGGTVTFACSSTITLTSTITITNDVTLDGANQTITLSGGDAVRLFNVSTGALLTIKNLTLVNGKHAGADGTNGVAAGTAGGGAVFNEGGTVTAVNCSFAGHAAEGGSGVAGVVQINGRGGSGGHGAFAGGGAIYNSGGTVMLTNCAFSGNSATGGDAGDGANGAASASNDGGNGGNGGLAAGGVLFNGAQGVLIAYDCTFASNHVAGGTPGMGGTGSGLGTDGSNGSPGQGNSGAIHNDRGTVTVTFSTFSRNSAEAAAGGDGRGGTGDRNGRGGTGGADASGGAILNDSGTLALTNCTFFANSVTGGDGGKGADGGTAGFGGDGGNGGGGGTASGGGVGNTGTGTVTLVNCTFSNNSASGGIGGEGGAAGSAFTDPGQEGALGGDNGGGVANDIGTLILKNTIVAYSLSGGEGFGPIADGGNNISFDDSIGFTQTTTSYIRKDPQLGSLTSNGGPTQTIPILISTNVAVNGGDDAACLPTDQRHLARSGRCDIGAFEYGGLTLTLNIRRQTNEVILSWTTIALGYTLQSKSPLTGTNWTNVTNTVGIFENQYVVTNKSDEESRFYRLIR